MFGYSHIISWSFFTYGLEESISIDAFEFLKSNFIPIKGGYISIHLTHVLNTIHLLVLWVWVFPLDHALYFHPLYSYFSCLVKMILISFISTFNFNFIYHDSNVIINSLTFGHDIIELWFNLTLGGMVTKLIHLYSCLSRWPCHMAH